MDPLGTVCLLFTSAALAARFLRQLSIAAPSRSSGNMDTKDEHERKAAIEAQRQRIAKNQKARVEWSRRASTTSADELVKEGLIQADQFEQAVKVIAQQLEIMLIAGRPPRG